jgi:ribosomal protein L31E
MESKVEEKFVLKQAEEDLKKKQEKEQETLSKEAEKEKPAKAEPKKAEKEKEKPKEEKKREIILERLYSVPLISLLKKPLRKRRGAQAGILRAFVAKHLKAASDKVKISPNLSKALASGGKRKVAGKVKVKCSKDKEGVVLVEKA